MSLGDLVITLICLRSTGMMEANPIASFLVRSTQSVSVLAAYKTLTVGICVGLLYYLRRHVEGEVAAWCVVAILAVTSLQWFHYTRHFDAFAGIQLARHSTGGAQWIVLD